MADNLQADTKVETIPEGIRPAVVPPEAIRLGAIIITSTTITVMAGITIIFEGLAISIVSVTSNAPRNAK